MKRTKGFLDLDSYYKDYVNKKNLKYLDLFEKGIIRISDYNDNHFWLTINGEEYYFKDTNNPYHEVLAYKIAQFLGIDAAFYDYAVFSGLKGVISKSYRKKGCTYIPGYQLLKEYYEAYPGVIEDMGLTNGWEEYYAGSYYIDMNNLEIIWQALEYKYRDNDKFDIQTVMKKIVDKYIFWIITRANDQGAQNWEIEETKNGEVDIAPLFDNEIIFFDYDATVAFSVSFLDNDRDIKESLRRFLSVSSQEFIDYFLEKFNKLNLNSLMMIISQVEAETGCIIPSRVKNNLLDNFELNQREIKEVLKELNIKGR